MPPAARQIARLRARLLTRLPPAPPCAGLSREDEVDVAISRAARLGRHTDVWVRDWLHTQRRQTALRCTRVPLSRLHGWKVDPESGDIAHEGGRFFTILGAHARHRVGTQERAWDQPCIDQPEVGILGILATTFHGILHVCLRGKEEPGNLHAVQLSPTVQATYSNYTGGHGGRRPLLVDLFLDPPPERILFARLQTEDGGRFLYKSNRNLILRVPPADVPHLPDSFVWLTLRQVADLLRHDNVINACARSVLSALV